MSRVHLVAKTHLDLGFTALAAEVVDRYLTDFFPRAMRVAAELRAAGGLEQLVWTTGSWLVWQALERGSTEERRRLERAIVDGDLAWHALPFTLHTELADIGLIESALGIAAELDVRFGRRTVAAKMTDVPGHTRGLVSLLAAAGIELLHIGVNPASPMPDVPPVFRWRSPDGAEIVVIYHAGGYGGFQSVAGCSDALAFLAAGDNLGPPSIDEVSRGFVSTAALAPGAVVVASTLDAFTRALTTSGVIADLPVVTTEIGDTWIHGAGSDPQKVARYRALLAVRRRLPLTATDIATVDRALLPVPEHTWGLDEKISLHDSIRWTGDALAELRREPETKRFEASWAEQRAYVDQAEETLRRVLGPSDPAAVALLDDAVSATSAIRPPWSGDAPVGFEPWPAEMPLNTPEWEVALDPTTGALTTLLQRRTGRALASADHPLALIRYQTFSAADFDRFHATYNHARAEDEWWALLDYTKPGIEDAGAVAAWWPVSATGQWHRRGSDRDTLLSRLTFAGVASEQFGAPPELWSRIVVHGGGRIDVDLSWFDKPACRLPEATWCSFVPLVEEPACWVFDKLGQDVSPLDVASRGGRSLHAVGRGASYDGPDGRLALTTADAALIAPGRPALLEFTDEVPDLSGGLHVLLHDNVWGTNFPMWNEGNARFRFSLDIGAAQRS